MKDYKLTDFEISDFKDDYGNTWCNATFEGFGEPVRWVVKDPETIVLGKSYYGEMLEKTSRANKSYQRFYKRERPDEQQAHTTGQSRATSQPKAFKPYEKDDTAVTLNMVWKNLLNVVGVPTNVADKAKFWDMVQYHTEELLAMSKFNKTNSKETPTPSEPKADIHEKLDKGFTKTLNEDDANDFLKGLPEDEVNE